MTLLARRITAFAFALILPLMGWAASAHAQTDPFNGTWMLKVEKSHYPPASPVPKSQIVVFEGTDLTKTGTADTVDAQGQTSNFVVKHVYDGQSHPAGGSRFFDALTYTRIDASTIIYTRLKSAKLVGIGSLIVSPDGAVMTVTGTVLSEGGGNYIYVYEKVR